MNGFPTLIRAVRAHAAATGTAILAFLVMATPFPALAGYKNPLAGEMLMTSTFGEFRGDHYHAGIDLSTGGVIGEPVFAVASGSLLRVRASGVGYGKAVYERIDDGRVVVYAHLDTFCDKVSEYVEAYQESLSVYEVDLFPEPGKIRFEEGELIGISGDSGTRAPHLHLEIRDEDIAVNPLTHGFQAQDMEPPQISSITFLPLDCGSTANGEHFPLTVGLGYDTDRMAFTAKDTVDLWGRFSVEARVVDRTGTSAGLLAPYQAALCIDGTQLYNLRFEAIPYGMMGEVNTTYQAARTSDSVSQKISFRRYPGTSSILTENEEDAGVIVCGIEPGKVDGSFFLPPGEHCLSLWAEDVSQNASEAVVSFSVAVPAGKSLQPGDNPGRNWGPLRVSSSVRYYRHCVGIEVQSSRTLRAVKSIEFSGHAAEAPPIEYSPTPGGIELFLDYDSAIGTTDVVLRLEDIFGEEVIHSVPLRFRMAERGRSGTVCDPESLVNFAYTGGTFYTSEPVAVFKNYVKDEINGLRTVSPVFGFRPLEIPFDGKGILSISFPETLTRVEQIGIYAVGPGGFGYVGGRMDDSCRWMRAEIRGFSDYALLRDNLPPVVLINKPIIKDEGSRAYLLLTIGVIEEGSGISASGVDVFIDGRKIVSEWAPDKNEIRVRMKNPTLGKKMEVRVVVRDRAGNERTSSSLLKVGE
ncbi:MAG: M23 family metallopeptidase [Candidatus Eisenbacteria bacterium]|nr:M23 family metallopeptidase [Candidatus Eisenbacteria bacterium]